MYYLPFTRVPMQLLGWNACFLITFLPLLFPLQTVGQALPTIGELIHNVEANQHQVDKTRENYTFREIQVMRFLNSRGNTKKEERREFNVFYVNGHPIHRLVRKDGAELKGADEAKENDHVRHNVELAQQTPPGEPLNAHHQIHIARILNMEHFTNERRVTYDNRPMIAVDFAGDPKAQTHGLPEDASKHLSGTIWIDEKDQQVRRVQATLDSQMSVELGLVSLAKGSSFIFEQKLINNEVWLPTGTAVHIEAKAALFLGYHVNIETLDDQYKRFHTTADAQDMPVK